MTIGQLAREGGVGVETVRYYQRLGLLAEPKRPPGPGTAGRVRRYGEEDARTLRFVRHAKAAGFTLAEAGELMRLDAGTDRAAARALAQARLVALDRRVEDLRASRAWLARLEAECAAGGDAPCPILAALDGRPDPDA